jgi:hypothetical protein
MQSTRQPAPPRQAPPFAVGGLLILIGGLWLLASIFDVNVWSAGWPLFVVIPGVIMLVSGLLSGADSDGIVPGTMVTITGLILLYQNSTGHWESWAYAWALIAPFGPGLGMLLTGFRNDDPEEGRRALPAIATGLVLFVAGVAFFEGLLGISGRDFGVVGDVALPALLIAAGAYFVFRRS